MSTAKVLKGCGPFILILLLGVVIYANSFNNSFHFDDAKYITHNLKIRDLSHVQAPRDRFIGFYSFALNYHFHKDRVQGYHLVNIAIHIINAFLVFWLITLITVIYPGVSSKKSPYACHPTFVALAGALIFLTHPLQTQAVTYIVQRFASLATMFYLSSLCFYLLGRLCNKRPLAIVALVCSAMLGALGMFTKQIVFTLPFMIILIELYFFEKKSLLATRSKGRWALGAVLLCFALIVPAHYSFKGETLFRDYISRSNVADMITPATYLLTQFRVICTYLRLVIFPIGQVLDYDFRISESFFAGNTFYCLLILLALLGVSVKFYRKSREVSFGILWVFLALSVESSFVPIPQVIFEHRMYLPMVGVSIALSFLIVRNINKIGTQCALVTLIILTLGYLTIQRNNVWKTDVSLWMDNVKKAPGKIRSHLNLAYAYVQEGKPEEAIKSFNDALAIDPDSIRAFNNRAMAYKAMGQDDLAFHDLDEAVKRFPADGVLIKEDDLDVNWAEVFINRGQILMARQQFLPALEDYARAEKIDAHNPKIYVNRGFLYESQGEFVPALEQYQKALALDPYREEVYSGAGICFYFLKDYQSAVQSFTRAVDLEPKKGVNYFYRALAYYSAGDKQKARDDMLYSKQLNYRVDHPLLIRLQNEVLNYRQR